jgi:hypothetical protein
MIKTVSSVTNAIGALNYKGTWNASANTPALASSVGTKGDYYVVSVAGSTTLNGISNWGVGDWAAFNGTTWQRVEGGADLNGVNVSFTDTASGPTFKTSNATSGLTIADNTIIAAGSATNISVDIVPKGTGEARVTSGLLNVTTNGLKYVSDVLGGKGLNVLTSQSFNNNSSNNVGLANHGFCLIAVNQGNGNTVLPLFMNAGLGTGWVGCLFDPDNGTFTYAFSPSVSFLTAGTSANTYTVTLDSNLGQVTIQRTAGSAAYTITLFRVI